MTTLKETETSLSCVQCFLYLVSSSINVSIFHVTWLDTFYTSSRGQFDNAKIIKAFDPSNPSVILKIHPTHVNRLYLHPYLDSYPPIYLLSREKYLRMQRKLEAAFRKSNE